MKVFLKNEIFRLKDQDESFRILWVNSDNSYFFAIDIDSEKAWPERFDADQVRDEIAAENADFSIADKYSNHIKADEIPDKWRKKQKLLWRAIKPIVLVVPDVFEKKKRNRLIKLYWDSELVTRLTLTRTIRRYWQRGLSKMAVLPDYKNSGTAHMSDGRGKPKRGRPRRFDVVQGINVDSQIKNIFKKSARSFYQKNPEGNFTDAYKDMIRVYFSDVDCHGELQPRHESMPTLRQFKYWYKKECDLEAELRGRKGDKNYEKDHRPILGTSNAEVYGPGAIFQIDSTVGDIYIVSKLDPKKIIGRPVIYEVIDVFSRMVVGVYIGVENASHLTAAEALVNAMTDKVAFCKSYGIDISLDQWPSFHVPDAILADNAELKAKQIENFIEAFSVRVENTGSYRADCKGIVERHFRTIQATFKRHLSGTIDKDFMQRGAKDYRLSANITIEDFTQAFIRCILFHNNSHEITKYDKDFEMMVEGVPAIPIELWNWGIANRSGTLRTYSENVIKAHLLPRSSAKVTRKGIVFKGNYYHCAKALEKGWYVQAGKKSWTIDIAYDPRNISHIYIPQKDRLEFDVCNLTSASRAFENMSLWDLQELQKKEKQGVARRKREELTAQVNLDAQLLEIARTAQARQIQSGPEKRSKSERVSNIRENREKEKCLSRPGDAMVLTERKFRGQKAPVSHIVQEEVEEDFSYPNREKRQRIIKEREDNER